MRRKVVRGCDGIERSVPAPHRVGARDRLPKLQFRPDRHLDRAHLHHPTKVDEILKHYWLWAYGELLVLLKFACENRLDFGNRYRNIAECQIEGNKGGDDVRVCPGQCLGRQKCVLESVSVLVVVDAYGEVIVGLIEPLQREQHPEKAISDQ